MVQHKFKVGESVKTVDGDEGIVTFCFDYQLEYKVRLANGFVPAIKEERLLKMENKKEQRKSQARKNLNKLINCQKELKHLNEKHKKRKRLGVVYYTYKKVLKEKDEKLFNEVQVEVGKIIGNKNE